jgi:cation transport regulator ChaC
MGRVATLVKTDATDRVYGVAYEIDKSLMDKTFEHLNFREKCGYSLYEIEFNPLDESINNGQALSCVCYFATEENPYFSSQTDLSLISYQIYKSRGPSGENKEYLFMLCNALRELANQCSKSDKTKLSHLLKYDEHLFELERLVLGLEQKDKEKAISQNFQENVPSLV